MLRRSVRMLRQMRIGMPRQLRGPLLLVSLACLSTSCRDSQPPKIEVCILDGFGGGDCIESDGSKLYRLPSDMLNYWATSQPDEANFASWCYQADRQTVNKAMTLISSEIKQ